MCHDKSFQPTAWPNRSFFNLKTPHARSCLTAHLLLFLEMRERHWDSSCVLQLDKHVESLCCHCSFPSLVAVASSSLTGQLWNGALVVFDSDKVLLNPWFLLLKNQQQVKQASSCSLPTACADASWLTANLLALGGDDGSVYFCSHATVSSTNPTSCTGRLG